MRIPVSREPFAEALLDRLDHVVESEPPLEVLLGRVADLGVDDPVGREILGALARDAHQRLARLHHTDRVRERLEVEHEVLPIGSTGHPGAELSDVARREPLVAGLVGELHDRGGTESAVQMVVEQDLGRGPDALERRRRHHADARGAAPARVVRRSFR